MMLVHLIWYIQTGFTQNQSHFYRAPLAVLTCESAKIKVTWHYNYGFIINFFWWILTSHCKFLMPRPHFKGLGMRYLLYELSIYQIIDNKATIIISSYFDFCWLTRYEDNIAAVFGLFTAFFSLPGLQWCRCI